MAKLLLNMATSDLLVCDYTYLPGKAIMMELFKSTEYAQCFSLNVAVPLLCSNEALAGECDGSQCDVIWCFISVTAYVVSGLKQGSSQSNP